jgi:hypothetical protein
MPNNNKRILLFGNSDPIIRVSVTSIAENTPVLTVVGTATIRGKYTGTPNWSITDPEGTFSINSGTGIYSVADGTALDYESFPTLPGVTFSVSGVTPTVPDLVVEFTVTDVAEGGTAGEPIGLLLTLTKAA